MRVIQSKYVAAWAVILSLGLWSAQSSIGQTRYFILDGFFPQSIQELSVGATLIVDAQVQSVRSTVISLGQDGRPGRIETDSLLRISRVLKGMPPGMEIVVSQQGGKVEGFELVPQNYFMMRAGQRYLLFLHPSQGSQSTTERSVPRYEIIGLFSGVFEFSDSGFRVPDLPGLISQVQGKTTEQILSEVMAFVKASAK